MQETKPELLLGVSRLLRWCLLQTDSQFFVFCFSQSSFLILLFICARLFILTTVSIICETSWTRHLVFTSLMPAKKKEKQGRPQMYRTWCGVSEAAARTCPVWQGLQIYSVDVPLHLWPRDEKIPLFFSHKHPPYPECTPPIQFLPFSPSYMPCGQSLGLTRVKDKVAVWFWLKSERSYCDLLEALRPLYNMLDQSSRERGDPLGDRFWLSPRKGKCF